MSYYLIPKVHHSISINPSTTENEIIPCISQTFINYYNSKKHDIELLCNSNHDYSYENIIQYVNTHEYIFTKVPGSNFSVSKLKPKSILFYDLFEIIQNINLIDIFKEDILNSLIIGKNYEDSLECLEMMRENYNNDKFFCYYEYNTDLHNWIKNNKFNFIIHEINNIDNINSYIVKFIETVIIITSNLIENGIVIIKIENIFYKPILDIIYLFSSLFEKTYIIKPSTNCISNLDKYIILKNFIIKKNDNILNNYTTILKNFLKYYQVNGNLHIKNIINNDLPYYFLNKIDDINLIIGQQQLELFEQVINILLSKNKEDKIESLKKYNIQKCVQWCEKFKIPCNKFSDKINIFLPVKEDIIVADKLVVEDIIP
jgi:hypothetical protein